MMRANALAIAAALAVPLNVNAAVERMWPESILLEYPIGAPGFPTIVGLEPNYISITNDASTVAVTTSYDLANADYTRGTQENTFRFNVDGMVNLIGTAAEASDISGNGSFVVYAETGALQRANADGSGEQPVNVGGTYFSVDNGGAKVAYVDIDDLYVANADGTGMPTLLHTTDPNAVIDVVQISGDGTKVVFAENPNTNELTPKPPELFVVDTDGLTPALSLLDGADEGATSANGDMIRGASITDDGSVVVFSKTWDPGIHKINSDASELVKIFALAAEWPKISGDGSTIAFLSAEQSNLLGGSSESGFLTPFSFPVASSSLIKAHVPFGLGIERNANVDWLDISQDGEWVVYTAPDDFFGGGWTRDFRDVYVYRSNGTSASGTTGVIPGGIGTQSDPDVSSLDRYTLALLLLALSAAILRGTRCRRVARRRADT